MNGLLFILSPLAIAGVLILAKIAIDAGQQIMKSRYEHMENMAEIASDVEWYKAIVAAELRSDEATLTRLREYADKA